jgi:hypothetical protein
MPVSLHQLRSLLILITASLCINVSLAASKPLEISIIDAPSASISDPQNYYKKALILALEKTAPQDGDFVIHYTPFIPSIERIKVLLTSDSGVDVIWASSTPERQASLRYVPFDLLQDLNNYRALLINKTASDRFNKITRVDELKKLRAGNGSHWTDTAILKQNQFKVTTAVDFSLLIKMLHANRIDFIPRGLHEVLFDLKSYTTYDLDISATIMLRYSNPIAYGFFVRQGDEALALRIERGLNMAQKDGSLEALFMQEPALAFGKSLLQKNALFLPLYNQL